MNSEQLKKDIEKIKKYVKEIKDSGIDNHFEIEVKFLNKYPELYDKYVFITKKIISGEDLSILNIMLKSLDNIKNGANKFDEEVGIGKILANKYIN